MAFDDGVKTVSGSIAHTDDAATKVPFVSVKCGIEPTLTGVAEIDVVRPDGNILQTVAESKEQNGVTWTVNSDGSITLSGKSTARTYLYVHLYHKILPKNATLTVSVEGLYDNGASDVFLNLPYSDNGTTYSGTYGQITWGSPKKTISYTADKYLGFLLDCPANVTTNQTIKVMVTIGSEAQTFEPYEPPTTYTASLGRTIYGGQADIVNGQGKAWGRIELGSLTWTKVTSGQAPYFASSALNPSYRYVNNNPNALVEGYTQASIGGSGTANGFFITDGSSVRIRDDNYTSGTANEFKEAMSGKYVVYELTTPTDFTFTPITPTPETVGKVNNVYCNTGNTELTYYDNAHGFAEVTVNRTNKNLLYKYANINTAYGLTGSIIPNSGGGVRMSGVPTWTNGNKSFRIMKIDEIWDVMYNRNVNIKVFCNNPYCSVISARYETSDHTIVVTATCTATTENIDIDFYVMLYVGNVTPTEFVPCVSDTQTAYLHKVIYGGQADVVKGTCKPKNLCKNNLSSETVSGVTITIVEDGTITLNGTATARITRSLYTNFDLKAGTYTLSCGTSSLPLSCYLNLNGGGQSISCTKNTPSKSLTLASDSTITYVRIDLANGSTFSNLVLYPMLEVGSSASEYAPYFDPFTFPPISISTDEGENTLFANEGDSSITYRKAVD